MGRSRDARSANAAAVEEPVAAEEAEVLSPPEEGVGLDGAAVITQGRGGWRHRRDGPAGGCPRHRGVEETKAIGERDDALNRKDQGVAGKESRVTGTPAAGKLGRAVVDHGSGNQVNHHGDDGDYGGGWGWRAQQ